jgi:hypothetical protein
MAFTRDISLGVLRILQSAQKIFLRSERISLLSIWAEFSKMGRGDGSRHG